MKNVRNSITTYIVSSCGAGMNIGVIRLLPSEVFVSICLLIGALTGVLFCDIDVGGVMQFEIDC